MSAATARQGERALSQTLKAQLDLRELILRGDLAPGERVPELQMVEELGVSRTPVRMALVRLEEEGLLEAIPSGGFSVKAFTEAEVFEAIEIRGTLEGLAARLAAERGVARAGLEEARACLARLDGIVGEAGEAVDVPAYVAENARFHALIVDFSGSRGLARQIERACALPFASPSALAPVQARSARSRHILTVAQDQHHCLLRAIESREGARAEAIAREHARIAHRNLERVFAEGRDLGLVPGAALIRRR
ncbi:GntR family transcriptional regulator [Methylobacterium sp. JK268]